MAWAKLEPALSEVDLRPYVFVARERAVSFQPLDEIPHALVPVLEVLASGSRMAMQGQQTNISALSAPLARLLFQQLEKLAVKENSWRSESMPMKGFTGAFRRSELVGLNLEHIELTDAALILSLPKSKTNQAGELEQKAVFYASNPLFCPIRAYKAWVELLGGRTEGPVFVSLARGKTGEAGMPSHRRLSDRRVNLLVKEHLGAKYSAHSLRASFITTAKLNGQSNEFIKNQTKQKTDAMISRYSRLDDIIAYNAAHSLGL